MARDALRLEDATRHLPIVDRVELGDEWNGYGREMQAMDRALATVTGVVAAIMVAAVCVAIGCELRAACRVCRNVPDWLLWLIGLAVGLAMFSRVSGPIGA